MARMALPQDLQSNSRELTVEGRSLSAFSKSFDFAPYHVSEVNRSWTKGKGFSIFSGTSEFNITEAKQKYEFTFNESGRGNWNVQCAAGAKWSQLETEGFLGGGVSIDLTGDKQLVCTLIQEGGAKPSKLVMGRSSSSDETAMQGVMINGATHIDISTTNKLKSTPLPLNTPSGYIFRFEGRPVGAVEVINRGTVWLNPSQTPEVHSVLAVTSAVLLLYQDVQEQMQGNQ